MRKLPLSIASLLFSCIAFPAAAALFHTIDTTSPLHCTFSYKFQNRVMLDKGKIQKVIASDEDRLSIFTDPYSGQIFISTRDYAPQETTVSVVTEAGVVQDLQVNFIDRSSEVVILEDPLLIEEAYPEKEPVIIEKDALSLVEEILRGGIPKGYLPCQAERIQWKPKKGVLLESIVQLEGACEILYLYQVTNTTKKSQTIEESELNVPDCRWVFLEANTLLPKQKILGIIAVGRTDE